jgi:hypothetical protein
VPPLLAVYRMPQQRPHGSVTTLLPKMGNRLVANNLACRRTSVGKLIASDQRVPPRQEALELKLSTPDVKGQNLGEGQRDLPLVGVAPPQRKR